MTNAAVDVALHLRLHDQATPAMDRAAERAVQAQRRVAGAAQDADTQQQRSRERVSRAREDLAGQSEQRIRRELELTEAAYNRAAQAAKLGAGVQAGALDSARAKVQALRDALERMQQVQGKPVLPTVPKNVPGVPGVPVAPTVPGAPVVPAVPAAVQPRDRFSYERMSMAREALGVRTEQRIQREIVATEAAYKRLEQSGKLSADALARALDVTRGKVTALTNEMGKVTREQQKQQDLAKQAERGGKVLQVGGMAVAGGAAGYMATRSSFAHAMSVDDRLRDLVNMGYRGQSIQAKRAGLETMRNAVDGSVAQFGGKRENATEAISMLLENDVKVGDAVKILPTLMKFSKAANADPTALAAIAMRSMQNFKIDAKDIPNVLNMALAAGSAGGFELKDMAKWLPAQLALASAAGMGGKKDLGYLLALNQAAVTTAGTKDEAGNNVVNLLGKIMGADTAKDVQKLGINHYAYLQKKRGEGMNSMEAFTALVDSTVAKRSDYKGLQAKLAVTNDEGERKAMLESMASIAQSAGIGTLIQDRQALGALLASLQQRGLMDRVRKEVGQNDLAEGGIGQEYYKFKSEGGASRAERAQQNVEAAKDRTLGDGGSVLGAVNDFVADVSAKFPVLAGSTALAATAVTGMAGAAGLAAIALARVGGAGGMGGSAITNAAGRAAPYLMQGGKLLMRGGAAAAAAGLGGMAVDAVTDKDSAANRYGTAALNGAAIGATVGSVVPFLGTALGAGVGAIGGALVQWLNSYENPNAKKEPTEPPRMQGEIKVSVSDDRVRVSQSMQAQGMDATLSSGTGNVWQGAPL